MIVSVHMFRTILIVSFQTSFTCQREEGHVVTKLAPILSHFLEQSVSLSDWSTHSCNTRLLAWQQCLDQSDKSCEEVLSKFKQYFQTKLMLHQMLPTFIATWGYTKKDFSNFYWERSKNDHIVCVRPLIIFENRDS